MIFCESAVGLHFDIIFLEFLFSSTRIDLPESGNESDVITITGKKENVEKAQKKIAQIQSEMANVVSGMLKKFC